MKETWHNDQLYLAERFLFGDFHTAQLSQLAIHKINSLRLAGRHSAFCRTHDEWKDLIMKTLLNYISPHFILEEEGFFEDELSN
jgi:uncharacterized NAD(P)/FAD-binding protein YdhS